MARPYVPGRKVSNAALKRMRVIVFGRDGFRCLACGWEPPSVPSPYTGQALSDHVEDARGRLKLRLLELDHVVPFKLGGRFIESNLQTLCNSCNARKAARVAA